MTKRTVSFVTRCAFVLILTSCGLENKTETNSRDVQSMAEQNEESDKAFAIFGTSRAEDFKTLCRRSSQSPRLKGCQKFKQARSANITAKKALKAPGNLQSAASCRYAKQKLGADTGKMVLHCASAAALEDANPILDAKCAKAIFKVTEDILKVKKSCKKGIPAS